MTPETDHLESGLGTAAEMSHPTLWAFARKLERERNEARELLREIRDDEVNAQDEADKFLRDHAPSELSKVTEQRDRLAEALIKCREDSVCEQVRMEKCRYTKAADESQANIDRAGLSSSVDIISTELTKPSNP